MALTILSNASYQLDWLACPSFAPFASQVRNKYLEIMHEIGLGFFCNSFLHLPTQYLIMKAIHISFRKQRNPYYVFGSFGHKRNCFGFFFFQSSHFHASILSSGFPTNPTLGVVIGLQQFHSHHGLDYLTSIWIFDSSQISNDTSYGKNKCSCEKNLIYLYRKKKTQQ